MRSNRSPIVGLIVFALLMGSVQSLNGQTGAIVGGVTSSADGSAIGFVELIVRSAAGDVAAGRTAEDGSFRITGLAAGSYAVSFQRDSWLAARWDDVRVRAGETTRIDVRLDPAPHPLNRITVTGGRRPERLLDAPASISVVDRDDIAAKPALTLLGQMEGVTGVDVIRTGLEGGFVATRGFNHLFDDQLLLLVDHRLGQVPGLRANLLRVLPVTNLDIDRIEVVRGPASALYGPNAADGVVHIVTLSPIDEPGIVIAAAGGIREQDAVDGYDGTTGGVRQLEARLARRFSDRLGVAISGRWFRGTDWRSRDPVEEQQRSIAEACLADPVPQNHACRLFSATPGELPDLDDLNRIGKRDFEIEHWTVDTRTDWRPAPATSVVASAGLERTVNSLDLFPTGMSQHRGGMTWYGHARVSRHSLFAQAFLIGNDVGPDAYTLRSGIGFADESTLAVAQVQHASELGRHRLTYGADFLATTPRTLGLIHGENEDDDAFTETGVYLQSETRLSRQWQLLAAARADHHSVLDDIVVSPRIALVFKPVTGHNLRATFNRAFFTPSANHFFADLFSARIPIGRFSYGIRAVGTAHGLHYRYFGDRPAMKSPFAILTDADPNMFLPISTEQLYALARELARAQDPATGSLLDALGTPSESEVSPVLRMLEPTGFVDVPGGFAAVSDLAPLDRQITSTLELGYKGLVDDRLLVSVDVYYTEKQNYIGGFLLQTPNVFLNGEQLVQFYVTRGLDEPTARAIAIGTPDQPGLAAIPLGVIQPDDISDPSPNLILAVRNFGDIDVFGAEVSAELRLEEAWALGVAASWISDDMFDADGLAVALNAPRLKTRAFIARRDVDGGLDAMLRYRFVDAHPFASGVFAGDIDAYHLVDVTLGYALPGAADVRVQLDMQNLFDRGYRTFAGAPELGRFTLARLVWSF